MRAPDHRHVAVLARVPPPGPAPPLGRADEYAYGWAPPCRCRRVRGRSGARAGAGGTGRRTVRSRSAFSVDRGRRSGSASSGRSGHATRGVLGSTRERRSGAGSRATRPSGPGLPAAVRIGLEVSEGRICRDHGPSSPARSVPAPATLAVGRLGCVVAVSTTPQSAPGTTSVPGAATPRSRRRATRTGAPRCPGGVPSAHAGDDLLGRGDPPRHRPRTHVCAGAVPPRRARRHARRHVSVSLSRSGA